MREENADNSQIASTQLPSLPSSSHDNPNFFIPNVNMHLPGWIRSLIVFSCIISLTLTVLVFIFQLAHPKSRYASPSFYLNNVGETWGDFS